MVLTPSLPVGNSKSARRNRQLLKQVKRAGYEVHLVSLLTKGQIASDVEQLQGFCHKVHAYDAMSVAGQSKLLGTTGWPGGKLLLQGCAGKIAELWESCRLVALSDATGYGLIAEHLEKSVKAARPRFLLDMGEPLSERLRMCARSSARPMRWLRRYEAGRARKLEAKAVMEADLTLVATEFDRGRLISRVANSTNMFRISNHIWTVGDGVVVPDESSSRFIGDNPPTVLFRGDLNINAHKRSAMWLVRRVLPAVKLKIPDVKMRFVGKDAGDILGKLSQFEGVETFDMQKDSMQAMMALRQSAVGVAPQRDARGAVDPVLTMLASGRPVVATETIGQSLVGGASMVLICARKEEGFAGQIIKLLANRDRAAKLGERARKVVAATGTWEVLWQPVSGWLSEQAGSRWAA